MTKALSTPILIYDTTLRDGSQREGLSLSIQDKLCIAHKLDQLGVPFIEGGWPGANPKDIDFFLASEEKSPTASSTSSLLLHPSSFFPSY